MFIQIGSVGFAVEDISAYDLEHKSEKGLGVRLMLKTRTEVLTPNGLIISKRGLYDFYNEDALKLKWFFTQLAANNQLINLDKQWSDIQMALQKEKEKLTKEQNTSTVQPNTKGEIKPKVHELCLEDQLKASLKMKLRKD